MEEKERKPAYNFSRYTWNQNLEHTPLSTATSAVQLPVLMAVNVAGLTGGGVSVRPLLPHLQPFVASPARTPRHAPSSPLVRPISTIWIVTDPGRYAQLMESPIVMKYQLASSPSCSYSSRLRFEYHIFTHISDDLLYFNLGSIVPNFGTLTIRQNWASEGPR
jgi:hypothetical protein